MIYQQFQQSPFQQRISGPRAWLAMAVTVSLICLSLFLLPFVLLFGAIALGSLVLFSRIYVARQLSKFNREQAHRAQAQAREAASQASTFNQTANVVRELHADQYRGRTFEHQKDEG
ncbi:hypothetical protein HRJ35_01645 [Shewanella oneidensis MR-1]|uniref:Uncharacterized protein n=1 Tax=Shewanella oneidensis (strain ATCC 700550 / JCM 31522 / CIP 106686 / LMG 19005 / NCIMB 14063 / MR-1) TaxID=211586 RepID=Q8E8U8_SHEON|nr:hypothetical protein [Shewanella oneidensis]AAN57519.1 uncharacterized protein SO_4558 [Shewanella oneidensis MR-1]MDX5998194.1 hypothetical protein [Shewanella oneidensis]MEE2029293.1 hypothetical protein [Shewanella oneidensis]QKG94818.1 hypothetical protein HRJ35_01645 [Shewanella oneidensis MR-1]